MSLAALGVLCSHPAIAEIKINGATTVTFGLMKPNKDWIEQKTGPDNYLDYPQQHHTQAGRSCAGPRRHRDAGGAAGNRRRKRQPRSSPARSIWKNWSASQVGNAYVQFIVHPSNPVQSLSKQQIDRLVQRKNQELVRAWRTDLAVLLIGEPTSSPHKLIREALNIAYAPDLRVVQNTNQTAVIVAQAPGALSYISTAHDLPERSKLKVVDSEVKLPLALFLAFRKNAPEDVKKVVEAAAAAAKR